MTGGPLDGRGAVVTGGGRGIGAAVARALSKSGAHVLVAARTSAEIEKIAAELRARGGKAWAASCDVTDEASVKRLGEAARYHLGVTDILVNNAGAAASASLRKITLEEWNRLLSINATSAFLCTREFAPGMAERGWGRVVNVASIAGLEGGKYIAHYTASKHAMIGLTRATAVEFAGTGVTVNAVCPGYVDTQMTDRTLAIVESRAGLSRKDALLAVLATTGQGRLVTPEEVAAEIARLCLPDADEITGQAVLLNPGPDAP